jgi:hypothetical protein
MMLEDQKVLLKKLSVYIGIIEIFSMDHLRFDYKYE